MTVQYAVTFEFANRLPITHRGTVAAGKVHTCVSRAVKDAQKALRPQGWSSLVCVLLERLDQPASESAQPRAIGAADGGLSTR
jgi:hypothetical protein